MMDITTLDLSEFNYTKNVLLKALSTFKIGGRISVFFQPKSQYELIQLIRLLDDHHIHFHLIGRASNILFADEMKTEVAISTLSLKNIIHKNQELTIDGGFLLRELCYLCAENGLMGLEGLSGIPGTVGGAVYMNAGAFGFNISDYLTAVIAYHRESKKIITYTKEECGFNYRKSSFMDDKQSFAFAINVAQELNNSELEDYLHETPNQDLKNKLHQRTKQPYTIKP